MIEPRLFEGLLAPLAILDREMRFLAASRRYREETGIEGTDVIGQAKYDVLPGAERLRDAHARALAGEHIRIEQIRFRCIDGIERWAAFDMQPWYDRAGQIGGILIYHEDIDQRVQADEALRQEMAAHQATADRLRRGEARFRGLLEASPDALIAADASGRILFASRRVETTFGYAPDELVGEPIAILLPDRFREAHRDHAERYMADPKVREMGVGRALFGLRKDGSEFAVDVSLSPCPLPEGQMVIAAVRDVTARQALESQLHHAQRMEAIGSLTGGMAHDFNNLLGVILGNLELLLERQAANPDVAELGGEAMGAALRGAELTRRLLAFSRQQPLQSERADLNVLVTESAKLFGRVLGEDIEITVELEGGLWPVVVDRAQLEAALLNLATNARDAMPHGGHLVITTGNRHLDEDYASHHAEVRPGDYAMIEVADTGAGMPPEVVGRIFEPFFTTKGGKGTGLGLAMVFGFMKQTGGHINVYSEVGIGTTFRLYVPRADTGAAASDSQPDAPPGRGAGESVLVVEDNAGLRRVVVRQLTEFGYRVVEAKDAAEALTLLEQGGIAVLFTDIVMPGGTSGYDLGRTAAARWPGLKIVTTSGFSKNGKASGALPHVRLLPKPYRKADLARAIRAALDDD